MMHPPFEMMLTGQSTGNENIHKKLHRIKPEKPHLCIRSGVFKSFPWATSGFGLAHTNYVRVFSIKSFPESIIVDLNIKMSRTYPYSLD